MLLDSVGTLSDQVSCGVGVDVPVGSLATPRQESLPMGSTQRRWRQLHGPTGLAGRHREAASATESGSQGMQSLRFTEQFKALFNLAVELAKSIEAEGILLLVDGPADWQRLKAAGGDRKLVVAVDSAEELAKAKQAGLLAVHVEMPGSPITDRLTQALLEAVADDLFSSGSSVVAMYTGFDAELIDSISVINLDEHLNRLTGRDLRQLETRVPLDTLKLVVDLAIEIGREGREGKPVGTIFVVGDSKKVLACSRSVGFDPVRGYSRKERNLYDPRVREGIKEIAQMDGAIIVSADGVVEAACRYLDCSAADVTLSKGLGARHWAAAAISRATKAVAITVSQTNGTVRIFNNGETVLRIEPNLPRPMVWKEFEYEPPASEQRSRSKTEGAA